MTDDDAREPAAEEPELAAYVIEGARSSRSRCKTCRRKIEAGKLRLGVLIEGPFGTGYLWHHLTCAAKRQLERVEEAYAAEAWKAAATPPDDVPSLESLRELREEADERRRHRRELPYAELAPSGRARCKHCEEPIGKGEPRVVLGREVVFGRQVRTNPINVHPRCVAAEILAQDCATEPEGFADALHAHSELDAAVLAAVLAEVGDLC